MQWLQNFITDSGTGVQQDDCVSWIVSLVLLLTLVSCQEPVNLRAKKVLIPLEVIAVLLAVKTQLVPLRSAPPDTCLDSNNSSNAMLSMLMRMNVPLDNGELPPISQWS